MIVCQERTIEADTEAVYLGAFLKDGADIEPIPLEESGHESFLWEVRADVPRHLVESYEALKKAGGKFTSKNAIVKVLTGAKVNPKTAHRHIRDLANRGLLVEKDGEWLLQTGDVVGEAE